MNRIQIEGVLVQKAAADPDFRQQLITDSRTAISEYLGVELPPDIEITVFEETPERLCLVLPAAASAELADADLAGISGGGAGDKETNPDRKAVRDKLRETYYRP